MRRVNYHDLQVGELITCVHYKTSFTCNFFEIVLSFDRRINDDSGYMNLYVYDLIENCIEKRLSLASDRFDVL